MKGDWITTVQQFNMHQHAAFESEYSCAVLSPMLYGYNFQANTSKMTAGLSATCKKLIRFASFLPRNSCSLPSSGVGQSKSIWSSMGWQFWYHHPCGQSKPLWNCKGAGDVDIILSLWTLQVKLKFHRGGNFDIIFSVWKVQVKLKFHAVGILISPYPCGQSKTIWSSMGVGILQSSYPCGRSKSIWSYMRVGILISSYPCGQSKFIWSSMGVGILISSYPCGHSKSNWSSIGVAILISSSPCGKSKSNWSSMRWEFWYHLIPVDSPRQFEVPWAWEF